MQPLFHRPGLCAALGVSFLVSCRQPASSPSRAEAAPRAVRVALAQTQPLERAIAVTGTLAAQEASILSAKVPGRLVRLAVDIGSRVSEGDLIAQIELRDYELEVQQAAAALAQTRAALGLSLDGDNDQVDLAAVSSVKQAQAVLEEAGKNRARVAQLSETGIASQSELDTVEANYTVAQTRYEVAREEARIRVASLAQRRAEYEIARKRLADATVRAPYAGTIQSRSAGLGEYVSAGTPIVTLVKTDPLRLRLEVPERESPSVCRGQTVRLVTEGLTNVFSGRISRLSPALNDQNLMLRVEADVPNPGVLRAGQFARAQIVVNEHEDGLVVPANTLITFAGIEKVITVHDGQAVEQSVTTGRRGSNWIEILTGLTAGTPVVLDPGGLRGGQALTVTGRTEAEAAPDIHAATGQ